MSATQSRSGATGANRRWTRSSGSLAAGSAMVVRLTLPRTAVQVEAAHQPLHGAPGDRDPFAVQLEPHLPGAVDAVVRGVHPCHLRLEVLVADPPPARRLAEALAVVVVGRWGDRQAVLGQHGADRL